MSDIPNEVQTMLDAAALVMDNLKMNGIKDHVAISALATILIDIFSHHGLSIKTRDQLVAILNKCCFELEGHTSVYEKKVIKKRG